MTQGAAKERLRPFKPQRFGRYTLLMPLSTGGMGEIFLARLEGAQGFEKLCVIKKILPHLAQDKDFVDRFVDEARILVKLSHGNVAQVLDMGLHEGAPYIALEFVDGKDLRRVVSRARERALQLPLSFILYVTTRLLDALAYAHRKRGDDGRELNLVHRDVSPQNILISYEGEVKVIDFGLAKSTISAARTHPSIVLGKFLYMSPEQARHQKVDRRSDLYAVGLCLYELIAGKGPFDGVAPGELMATVANPQIAPLGTVEPLCPPSLSDVVMKALAVDAAQRFQTAEELRGKLLSILLEIDPSAGPETASRFMTEAFANEYQTERRLLSELTEQARGLTQEAEPPTEEDPGRRSVTREALSMPALTLDEVPIPAVSQPKLEPVKAEPVKAEAGGEAKTIETLSFQPTRKAPAPPEKRAPPENPGALPSVMIASEAKPTEQMDISSVVLDEALAAELPPEPKRPEVTQKAPRPKAGRTTNTALKAQTRPTKEKRPVRADTPAETDVPDHTPVPADRTPVPTAAPARSGGGSMLVWLALPVLAVAAVGGYIAWDRYTERLREEQQAREEPVQVIPDGPERSREVKVPGPAADPPVNGATPDELDLLQKLPKKPPVAVVKAEPKGSPGEKALRALKADLKQLSDESQARPFLLKLRSLEDRLAEHGAEASFVAEVNQLHAGVREALSRQQ